MEGRNISVTSLIFLFLFSVVVVVGDEGCSSSCGQVQSIRYPFRLKGDPTYCGDVNYELTCNNNRTFLELSSDTYLVTNISYEDYTIQVVSVGLTTGNCSHFLPPPAPSFQTDRFRYYYYYYYVNYFVSFVTCSKKIKIQNDRWYRAVPCLSHNNRFLYVTSGSLEVGDINPFCSFLSSVPTQYDITSSQVDVFQALQEGFTLGWFHSSPEKRITSGLKSHINGCLAEAKMTYPWGHWKRRSILTWFFYPIRIEIDTFTCLNSRLYSYYDHDVYYWGDNIPRFMYNLLLVSVILIDIAAFLSVIAFLVRFMLAPLAIYAFLAYKLWKALVPIDNVEKFLQKHLALTPTRYSYTDIIAMTNHFKEKLGQGGFGSVFKGELPGGFLVAIKVLSISKGNGEEFISEVSTIGSIHHLNVVRLVGFCADGSKRALVYEFMPKGSLDKYIFSSNGTGVQFTKKKLNEIALGVARGIDYLHRGCDMRILHFDIKPHNILLDHNFNPRVSDFGLAKLYPKDYSLVSACAARGTVGYMAPELVSRSFGLISDKSDVYSFGMLLMEMAGKRRNVDPRAENSSQTYYPSWVYDQIQQRESLQMSNDNAIRVDDIETKLCKVGLWCIQIRTSDRPSMSRVIEMLEADTDTLPMPPKPFSFSSEPASLRQSYVYSSTAELSIISETSDPPSLH